MRYLLWSALSLFVAASPCTVNAQELASSFDQLRVLLKAGDVVTVTASDGQETRGRVAALTATSLDITVAGVSTRLTEPGVATISRRQQDSLANGAKWGAGIGSIFGLLAGFTLSSEFTDSSAIPAITVVYAFFGAGVGVGIDALVSKPRIIYSRASGRSASFALTSTSHSTSRGLAVVIRF